MKRLFVLIFALFLATQSGGLSSADAATVRLFAAASLADSLQEISATYEKQSGDRIVLNLGASSLLARQIEEGAPADIFFSADEAKMRTLERAGLLVPGAWKSRLSNTLIIVAAKDDGLGISGPQDLATDRVKRLAIAEPRTVPAGIYAKEYLEKAGLWSKVESKIVPAENVRAALATVEAGNAQAGIVYKTDAAISKNVSVVYEVPAEEGPDISYPLALLREAREPAAAKRFFQYLASKEAGRVFEMHGFIVRE